jgi:hypothetical protein
MWGRNYARHSIHGPTATSALEEFESRFRKTATPLSLFETQPTISTSGEPVAD